ncbi:hypothetical protein V5799_016190 [Amblyomma americanum]|uniref:Secreted protein n=1 Tax=Amblyomma americanum TaxID=6943 RepID=A0AAQ4F5T8_AMBAM
MEKLGVIVICVLAGMTYARGGIQVGQGSSEMPQEIKTLLQRVNPWKVVNNSDPVYLTKFSGENSIFQSLLCVSSEYLRYEYDNKTTYRTLQATFNNKTVAVNISLQVQTTKEVYPPTLIVHFLRPDSAGCSMWIPGNYLTKPPLCCEFIYFLLCGAKVTAYDKSKYAKSSVNGASSVP